MPRKEKSIRDLLKEELDDKCEFLMLYYHTENRFNVSIVHANKRFTLMDILEGLYTLIEEIYKRMPESHKHIFLQFLSFCKKKLEA